jgi:hypothetical protein
MPYITPEAYLSERIDEQLDWLNKASKRNKNQFVRLRILEIVLGSFVAVASPLMGNHTWAKWVIPLSGAGIAISGSVLALNRNQENWVRYRTLVEQLKREKFLFLSGVAPYEKGEAAFTQFVRTVEDLMTQERTSWVRRAQEGSGSTPETPLLAPAARNN